MPHDDSRVLSDSPASLSDLADRIGQAASLVRSLAALDERTALQVEEAIARLVDLLSKARACEAPAYQASRAGGEERGSEANGSNRPRTLNDMALCDLLFQLGVVTGAQVDMALEDAARTGRAVEESLCAIGAVGPEDVARAVKLQQALGAPPADKAAAAPRMAPTLDAFLLGEILVSKGRITREELERALVHQHEARVRLGEALVELDSATWDDVAEALRIQKVLRLE